MRQAQLQAAGLPDWLGKEPASAPNNPKPGFRDAYKWGPFIMMGNNRLGKKKEKMRSKEDGKKLELRFFYFR